MQDQEIILTQQQIDEIKATGSLTNIGVTGLDSNKEYAITFEFT